MPLSAPPTFKGGFANITLGAAGTVLTSNGATTAPTFQAGGGGGGSPGGANGAIQYNNAGTFDGTGPGTANFVLTSNGAGLAPTFQALPSNAPAAATFIVQTANGSLPNAQALSTLSSGLVHNTTATGVLSVSPVIDSESALSVKPAVTVVATTNQALTGTPVIDSQATAAGSLILATAQTAPAENGPWVAAAGAWSRPSWYPAGGTQQAVQFSTTLVRLGTVYQGSTWRLTTAAPITIDTTATTWVVTPLALNATTTTGLPVGANPTGTVGLAIVNGSAATFLRSDGAPALDQSIAPTMTGAWVYTNAVPVTLSSTTPRLVYRDTAQAADEKQWDENASGKIFAIRTRTDADGAGVNCIAITRGTGTAITNIALANATNNPTGTWLGTGAFTFGGAIISATNCTFGRITVTSSSLPTLGIYTPGANRLGLVINSLRKAEVDASGNFLTLQATADQSYSLQVPTTGFTITIADNTSSLILNPAGTLATGTITMPATPINGQLVRVCTSQIITTLTVSANAGQTITGAPTTLPLGGGFGYIYNLSGTNWYRLY